MDRGSLVVAAFIFLTASSWLEAAERKVVVDISEQTLFLYDGVALLKSYPTSTSKFGIGNRQGSFQTPLGLHRVRKKIGGGAPWATIFKNRVNTGQIATIERGRRSASEDFVTSRILWLEGLEPGKNRGKRIDSFKRFIYIHGTASEGLIGQPASNGCVRLTNKDVIDLYERVPEGATVDIRL